MENQLISCDHCSNDVEVAVMLTSVNPTGERVVCENCFEDGGRRLRLYFLRMMYAWQEYAW